MTDLLAPADVLALYPPHRQTLGALLASRAQAAPERPFVQFRGRQYASAGNGTITHLAGEFFRASAGVDLVHVPYKGSSAAVTAVVSGEADLTFDTLFTSQPFIQTGRLHPLANAGPARLASMPQLPTIGETYPGFTAFSWMGFMGPPGMPADIVAKWSQEILRIAQLPDVREKLAASGVEAGGSTPAEFSQFVEAEIAKWTKVVAEGKIPKVE